MARIVNVEVAEVTFEEIQALAYELLERTVADDVPTDVFNKANELYGKLVAMHHSDTTVDASSKKRSMTSFFKKH